MIFPFPFAATSWGLYTGIAPVPRISAPTNGLLHDLAAAIKLIGLETALISNYIHDSLRVHQRIDYYDYHRW
jgi:hypothetical protein